MTPPRVARDGTGRGVLQPRLWLASRTPARHARPPIPRRGPAVPLCIVGGALARPAATALGGAPLLDAVPLIDWFGEGR